MFELPKSFVDAYRARPVAFGWGALGEVAFKRTYSRTDNPKAAGPNESWADVCERAINGMYTYQETWCKARGIHWNSEKALLSASEAYNLMFDFKWSPPGRGLWMAGTPFVTERGVGEALQNCAFISSEYIEDERGDFFRWLMEMSMLGVGVGFDIRGANRLPVYVPGMDGKHLVYVIPDTREGWAHSVELLIDSYLNVQRPAVRFDYDRIRPKGSPIKGFGGIASGPGPLIALHVAITDLLDERTGKLLSGRDIVDLCNMIGKCVVSGNVRRSAEISFGSSTDQEFINLKNYKLYPERADYGWVSNNSVFAEIGQDYKQVAELTHSNGEPGYFWLDNARQYGRMDGIIDTRDSMIMGTNPCGEQPLGHREMCTLVEIYLPRCKNKEEFRRAIKYAYLYGKSMTLLSDTFSDPITRNVMTKNRRIGLSVTGITQFSGKRSLTTLADWLDHGYHWSGYYDQLYSQWLRVERSVRRTSVKPSGTVSLVAGVTPGIHFNVADRFHLRRMTLAADSPLVEELRIAGYPMEASAHTPDSVSVMFPIDAGPGVRSVTDVSMEEQLALVAVVQQTWADNAVSATVQFDPEKVRPADIERVLGVYQHKLKGVSFLAHKDHGYAQPPYESIGQDVYASLMAGIKPMNRSVIGVTDKQTEAYCEGDACIVPMMVGSINV